MRNKYLKLSNYINAAVYLFNRYPLHVADCTLAPDDDGLCKYPPIFFVGAPRCGSTLIFQVITDAFDLGYLTNAHCRWFGSPALAQMLMDPLANKPASDYRSNYGTTDGRHEPSECGNWWYRFFPADQSYVGLNDVAESRMKMFRRSVRGMINAFERPVAFKNLYASIRLPAIVKYLPEALFVVVRRNEIANATSLLSARKKNMGSYDSWFSVPTPDVEILRTQPAPLQVLNQIRSIYRTIGSDLASTNSARVLELDYEQFCSDVHGSLEKFADFLTRQGVSLQRLHDVPPRFAPTPPPPIPTDMLSDLQMFALDGGLYE